MKFLRLLSALVFATLLTAAFARAAGEKAKPAEKECCKDKDGKECAADKDKAKDKDSCCDDEKPAAKADASKEAKK